MKLIGGAPKALRTKYGLSSFSSVAGINTDCFSQAMGASRA
jgi:hypothetical protein